ncbi:MAG TPA: hypothetical protein VFY93_03085 [Planctomycetota bacterium]|nr:hypothetical protein [Planctomycetota bacterium]
MTNRITTALFALASVLCAQEAQEPVTRVYDLAALATRAHGYYHGESPGPVTRPFSLLGSSHANEAGRVGDSLEEESWAPGDVVVETVRAFVGEVEGIFELEAIDGGLRVLARMKEADQKTVARVLDQIRMAGDPAVQIDVRHLTIPDRSLDDATRAMLLAPGRIEAEQLAALQRLDVRGGRQGGTVETALGQWAVYRDVRELRYVPDFDVEIAQGASVPDPVPSTIADGLKAAIRPFVLRDGRCLLRVVSSMGDRSDIRRFEMGSREVQDVLRLRNTDFGEVEQCDFRGGAVSTEMVVVPGKPAVVVLGVETGTEVRWDLLALTVNRAPRAVTGDTFAVTPVGALVAGDAPRSLAWDSQTGELMLLPSEEGLCRFGLDELPRRIDFRADLDGEFLVAEGSLFGGSLLLRGPAAGLRNANDRIAALERELIRPAQLEIRIAVVGNESRTAGLLAAPLTLDRKAAMAAYLRMDTVGDYDVEVAQEARIADPNHVVVTAGAFANALLSQNLDGGYRLDLDLVVSAAPGGIQTSAARAGGVPAIQTVAVSRRITPIRVDLVPDRPRTVELGTNPFGAGADARLVAVITVVPQ